MKTGDLVELNVPHDGRAAGTHEVVAGFLYRRGEGKFVAVRFDDGDDTVPEDKLAPATGQLRVTDQTTSSDEDRASNEHDQRSADGDQAASDADLAAGGNPNVHASSKAARDRSTQLRADIAKLRSSPCGYGAAPE